MPSRNFPARKVNVPQTSTTGVYGNRVRGLKAAWGHSSAPAGPGQISMPDGVGEPGRHPPADRIDVAPRDARRELHGAHQLAALPIEHKR